MSIQKYFIIFLLMISLVNAATEICTNQPFEYNFDNTLFGEAKLVVNNITVETIQGDRIIFLERTWSMFGGAKTVGYRNGNLILTCNDELATCQFESPVSAGDISTAKIYLDIIEGNNILYDRLYVIDEDGFACHWRLDILPQQKNLVTEPICDNENVLKNIKKIQLSFVQKTPYVSYENIISNINLDYPNKFSTQQFSVGDTIKIIVDNRDAADFIVSSCTNDSTTTLTNSTSVLKNQAASFFPNVTYIIAIIFILIIVLIIIGAKKYVWW